MDDNKRMAALQSKSGGAPPAEPPMAPPAMADGPSPDGGGMPPAEVVVPEIAKVLKQVADTVQDADKKSMLMSAAEQLQAVFPDKPQPDSDEAAGMSDSDSEAYGEPTPGK